MRKYLSTIVMLALVGCTTPPKGEETPIDDIAVEAPIVAPQKPISINPVCSRYNWRDRGLGPVGYFVGMASVTRIARSRLGSVVGKPLGDPSRDSLAHYASEFRRLGIPLDTYDDRIRATYLLLTGLGMRESSGNYWEGWDESAKTHTAAGAEAGLFQISFDARDADPSLKPLTAEYRNGHADCMLDLFKQGTKVRVKRNSQVIGSGDAAVFQRTMKDCPAWAAEFAAVLLRVNGGKTGHFGPIRRREAELKKECY